MFHNGSKFDFKLIVKYLAEKNYESYVSCIGKCRETFLCITIHKFNDTFIKLKLIDLAKHLAHSLDSLIKYLSNNHDPLKPQSSKDTTSTLKQKFSSLYQHFGDDAIKLIGKGVDPYDYMGRNWLEKLNENWLPSIEYFHSKLNNSKCSVEDVEYAKFIFDYFQCKNLGNWNNLCGKTNVLSLAGVLSNYRKEMHQTFGLDPIYFMSIPRHTYRAILKYTQAKIKLTSDINIYTIFEKGIGGRRCKVLYHHVEANN